MARTFNTPPQRISKPNKADVQNRFFNQYEWKGMDTDKNFLTVDQQTFQECNNVYADAENLLKSRPAIKRTTDQLILDIGDIVNFWSFNDVSVYLSSDSDTFYIYFVKDGDLKYSNEIQSNNIKLKLVDNKIWILDTEYLAYFNTLDYSYHFASDFIYVPKTKVFSGFTSQENESPNILTNKEIYVYLYNSINGLNQDLLDFTTTIEMLGNEYTVTFTRHVVDVIVEKKCVVVNSLIEETSFRHYVVEVSKNGSIMYYNTNTNSIMYSPDGISFIRVISCSNLEGTIIQYPNFSEDGSLIYLVTKHLGAFEYTHLYAISVLADSAGGLEFENWYILDTREDITYELIVSNSHVIDSSRYFLATMTYDDWYYDKRISCRGKYNGLTSTVDINIPETYWPSSAYGDLTLTDVQNLKIHLSENLIVAASCIYTDVNNDKYRVLVVLTFYRDDNIFYHSDTGFYITGYDEDNFNKQNKIIDIASSGNTSYVGFVEDDAVRYSYFTISGNTISGTVNVQDFKNIYAESIGISSESRLSKIYFNNDCTKILTNIGIYFIEDDKLQPLLTEDSAIPVGYNSYAYYITDTNDEIVSNNVTTNIEILKSIGSGYNYFLPSHESELSAQYWSKGNNLYIGQHVEDKTGNFMWYFPKSHVQKFNYPITNLIPISKTEMGVFFEHEIWYVEQIVANDNVAYTYTKSKLPVGVREGSDVIVTFDGSAILFTCERGLVMLAYQDLVASTEQILTFASDNIATLFKEFNNGPIKLYEYDFWIIAYKQNSNQLLVYDKRTGSWYPQTIVDNLQKIITVDYVPQLHKGGTIYNLDNDVDAYFDYDGSKKYNVPWNIMSQKLHLGANNHYKHIYNITLSSVLDTETPLSMVLNVQNYRKKIDTGKPQILEYKVDTIRTFVKRLNHAKVNEFQYLLSNDEDNVIQKPLSLANISVKYKILEEVR